MVVCLTGSHSTGKSTLVEFFRGKEGFVCIDSVTRSTISDKERKIDGNENLDASQLKMMDAIIQKLNEIIKASVEHNQNVYLTDRSVLDFLAYSKCFKDRGLLSEEVFDKIRENIEPYINRMDLFVYLKPEFGIVDDGVRSLDETLRSDVDLEIERLLFWHKVKAIKITGSVKERVNQIKEAINRL